MSSVNQHPANRPENMVRRTRRARQFGVNTCPASRHAQTIGETLLRDQPYAMLTEEPRHVGGTILSVVESLFKARAMLIRHGIDPWSGRPIGSDLDRQFHGRQMAEASARFQQVARRSALAREIEEARGGD